MKISSRAIADGEMIPSWYAVTYWDPMMRQVVCHPIGIHWVVRLGRIILRFVKFGWWEQELKKSYEHGVSRGWGVGYHEGLMDAKDKLRG